MKQSTRTVVLALLIFFGTYGWALLSPGCAPGLREQQSLASISHNVQTQCLAKHAVCKRAVVCIGSIKTAEEAIQLAVEERAKGTPDDELDVQAVALTAGARATCTAACFSSTGIWMNCTVAPAGVDMSHKSIRDLGPLGDFTLTGTAWTRDLR